VIAYRDDAAGLDTRQLDPFFEGWPVPPSAERRLACLTGADLVELAFDGERLVGFATALSDGALTASIPLVEVVSSHRGQGIGSELVRRLVARLDRLYGVDVCCDPEVVPFYARLGFARVEGMVLRRPGGLP
jgi:GNAT superfamily N-acetyltransferase